MRRSTTLLIIHSKRADRGGAENGKFYLALVTENVGWFQVIMNYFLALAANIPYYTHTNEVFSCRDSRARRAQKRLAAACSRIEGDELEAGEDLLDDGSRFTLRQDFSAP